MPDSPDHHDELDRWIESATEDLTRGAAARLAEEFRDHYAEAYDAAIAEGRSEAEAHTAAMRRLGDPNSTHRAAIPVHGDPHRLKVKGALVATGVILCVIALGYARKLESRADAGTYYQEDLGRAMEQGYASHVREILDSGLEPTGEQLGPRMWEVFERDEIVDIMRLMLEQGADPNWRTKHGKSSLILELTRVVGSVPADFPDELRGEILDLLVEYDIDLSPVHHGGPGQTLMSAAAYFHDHFMIEKLVEFGMTKAPDILVLQNRGGDVVEWAERDPTILSHEFENGAAVLHLVAASGDVDTLRKLIDLGADITKTDDAGHTLLHHAFYYWGWTGTQPANSFETQSYLLELGCDPNARSNNGYTPLHFAVIASGAREVEMLLEAGADPNVLTDTKVRTSPLLIAVNESMAFPRNEDVALMLIEAGADVRVRGQHDRTPLHLAAESNMPRVIRELAERGASLTARDAYLEEHMQVYIVHLFTPEDFGNMPIHLAAIDGGRVKERHGDPTIEHTDALETLIDLGSDINAPGGGGRTPLQLACENNNYKSVRLLLQRGADPSIPDDEGKTALHTEDRQLVELFAEFGYQTISSNSGGVSDVEFQ